MKHLSAMTPAELTTRLANSAYAQGLLDGELLAGQAKRTARAHLRQLRALTQQLRAELLRRLSR
jgi:hypothetical protein